jgi:hypothetical protein
MRERGERERRERIEFDAMPSPTSVKDERERRERI